MCVCVCVRARARASAFVCACVCLGVGGRCDIFNWCECMCDCVGAVLAANVEAVGSRNRVMFVYLSDVL